MPQQLVQQLLFRIAEPQQERLMHLFEQRELRLFFGRVVAIDRLEARPGARPAQFADERVVQDAKDPGLERLLAFERVERAPSARHRLGDQIFGVGIVAGEPPGDTLQRAKQRHHLRFEELPGNGHFTPLPQDARRGDLVPASARLPTRSVPGS
jgi:hypothetical protein